MQNNQIELIPEDIIGMGAYKAAFLPVSEIKTDRYFRTLCENNVCGKYGKCWTCPPSAGDIDTLMESLGQYKRVLVY